MPSISLTAANALPTLLVVVKATTILIAALLVTVALQRSSASTRHQVWLVAMAGLIALPVIATFVPVGVRVLPARVATASSANTGTAADGGATSTADGALTVAATKGVGEATDATVAPGGPPAARKRAVPLGPLFLGAWALVAAILLGRLLFGMLAVHRIVRGSVPLEDPSWNESLYEIADRLDLDDAPALLRSTAIPMPFAAGLRRALIVLPADADEWSAEKREAVLIHELGHVRRHDMIGHTLGRVACALYWFHPLVWTAARRLRDASERACDDLALRLGAVPSDYAQHLLDIVTKVRNPNTPTAAIAMARRKEFEGRMLAILDPALNRGEPSRGRAVLMSIALAGFVFAVSAAAPTPRETMQPPPTPEPTPASPELPVTLTGSTRGPAAASLHQPSLQQPGETVTQPEPSVSTTDDSQASPDVMQQLIERLGQDSSAEVRRVAAWGLQRYADEPAAQAALAKALAGDADADVRKMAAWSLAHTRAEPTLAALRTAFSADGDDGVREMAVWGLGARADAASAAAISRALAGEQSEDVRGTAAWALGRLQPDRAPAALVALLDSPDSQTRLMTAWALSEIGDSTALPRIQAALEKNPGDGATTRALLRALVRSGSSEASLTRFLSSANPEVRLYAIKSLAGGGGALDPWPWPRPIPFP